MVQIVEGEAYLYALERDREPSFLTLLARGAKDARFEGRLILVDLDDGTVQAFGRDGAPAVKK